MTKALPGRRNKSTADKIWAVGLAGATCVGLVGVIGVKTAEAQTQKNETTTAAVPVVLSSGGLTQEQLDVYAAQLEEQRVQLAAYSAELTAVSTQLAVLQQQQLATVPAVTGKKTPVATSPGASTGNQSTAATSKPKPVTPPPLKKPVTVIRPAAPAQQPQTVTKTS